MDTVEEVLVALRDDTASTHWCQSHYEMMEDWFGTPEEVVARMPRRFRKRGVTVEDVESWYKVKHCLVGMVNATVGMNIETSSEASEWHLRENAGYMISFERGEEGYLDGDDEAVVERVRLWKETINRLGLTIFEDGWDPETRQPTPEWVQARQAEMDPDSTRYVPQGLEGWNDQNGLERDDVLAMLDRALEAERAVSV